MWLTEEADESGADVRSLASVAAREGFKAEPGFAGQPVFSVRDLSVHYGKNIALKGVTMDIRPRRITAIIGPSGCGKSTLIRCFNRMNELIPGAKVTGEILYHGENIYAPGVDPVVVRRHIGMVFQRPNPFPKSIYDNIA
ncbi:MAG: ATP-binding cassette domain-containing protein, partial [Actinobacteria bacterium]|nr:ATP-binding cassette domain-containing protein [Actinomycetota bacterium]